ncbi:hypothetical protein [Streptomyces sp. cg36]|uniref:hypothetical protein n=1 Tax=Streptomyces sp. cg36 TaxID=3238798 RepID=UPI0034E2D1F4
MSVWMACVWGLLGAGALEAHQLRGDIARVRNLPWRVRGELPLGAYLTALALRLALGVGLAAVFGASGQAGGPVGVMAVGIAAPTVVEQLAGRRLAEAPSVLAPAGGLLEPGPAPGPAAPVQPPPAQPPPVAAPDPGAGAPEPDPGAAPRAATGAEPGPGDRSDPRPPVRPAVRPDGRTSGSGGSDR